MTCFAKVWFNVDECVAVISSRGALSEAVVDCEYTDYFEIRVTNNILTSSDIMGLVYIVDGMVFIDGSDIEVLDNA